MISFYDYVFRGLLTEDSLDKAGRKNRIQYDSEAFAALSERVGLNQIDKAYVDPATKMSIVFTAITSLENSIRDFISKKLLEEKGENWWETQVSAKVKQNAETRKEEETKHRYHTQRGANLIDYTEFGDLVSIIQNEDNWPLFEPHLTTVEWVKGIISELERSRNVIMHSGYLDDKDIERVGMNIRDWIKQVG